MSRPGEAPGFKAEAALRRGVVWTPRDWSLAAGADSPVSAIASAATPDKGKRFAEALRRESIASAIARPLQPRRHLLPVSQFIATSHYSHESVIL